jgi:carbonic anhydrase
MGLLLAWAAVIWHPTARGADEPVDVPITRGKVDLSSINPPLTTPAAGHSDTAPAKPAPSTPARLKPRTVADYAAEAKAKAAADAAASASVPVAAQTKATSSTAVAPVKPEKAPQEGLDKVAIKLVEAMARASAKQDQREAVRKPPKKAAASPDSAATAHNGVAAQAHSHWSYEGDTGPANWAKLKPEFNVCAIGQRQSPIPINDSATLQGPAEPIGFHYRPSEGSVVHNGHTIQVDVAPGNHIAVRGVNFDLLQFHFHHPSEEQVNGQRYPMVAHLVHKNAEGQLAVVAVLLTTGEANTAIDTVWKYLPVDTGDRVKLPPGVLNLLDLLPKDQRYYQFMGSLTTPPCTEGVLWMVLKTPSTLSPAQIRLFGQLFPNNARPVQELNGRPVREGL